MATHQTQSAPNLGAFNIVSKTSAVIIKRKTKKHAYHVNVY